MADSPNRKVQTNFQPCIIVHGGAWAILDVLKDPSVKGVKKAAEIGYESLITGGTAVDAVEAAVRSLEDDPTFDAGHGSVLTEELTVEVDAMIMDGNTLESGTKLLHSLALILSNLWEVEVDVESLLHTPKNRFFSGRHDINKIKIQ